MSEMAPDDGFVPADSGADAGAEPAGNPPVSEGDRLLASRILKRIAADKRHHKDAFKRMRRDMEIARRGACKADWPEDQYTANITGRHLKQLVSTLYAKNPKAIARRRPRLDFAIWDENEATLMAAFQVVQQYQMAMAAAGPTVVPLPGMAMPVPPEVMQAQALIADFQAGMQERDTVEKIGKTLGVLFDYYMQEQKPVDFKTSMKQLVRRTGTCGVGYVELGFQREWGQNEAVVQQIADCREHLRRLKVLAAELGDTAEEGATEQDKAKARELELSMQSLQQQEYLLLREGLIFDFPLSTQIIPDQRTTNLTGFVGARWVTREFLYTPEEVRGIFGIDLGREYTPYTQTGESMEPSAQYELTFGGEDDGAHLDGMGLACVYKHYDRSAGLVYYVCEGFKGFLRPPGPPDIYVEDFWPIYALTFNEGEDTKNLFPLSDVSLLYDMQMEYNRSRQGKREHRRAARPRYVTPSGTLSDESKLALEGSTPHSVTEVNNTMGQNFDIAKVLQVVPVPGVDPNLYDTNEIVSDMNLVAGTSPTAMGTPSKTETATGEALAEDSRTVSAGSNVDDIDSFLTVVARASGQIMLREVSAETARKIAGRGAVWPELTLEDVAGELYLEVEAGSSGKPNAAQEIRNWREMLPFLIQMPGIQPTWLARESLRRLDDRMDLTDALADGLPAIVSMNRMSQAGPEDPGSAPEAQGGEGGQNGAPKPQPPAGGERGMGNNRV